MPTVSVRTNCPFSVKVSLLLTSPRTKWCSRHCLHCHTGYVNTYDWRFLVEHVWGVLEKEHLPSVSSQQVFGGRNIYRLPLLLKKNRTGPTICHLGTVHSINGSNLTLYTFLSLLPIRLRTTG